VPEGINGLGFLRELGWILRLRFPLERTSAAQPSYQGMGMDLDLDLD
jgi:hypothetical protein